MKILFVCLHINACIHVCDVALVCVGGGGGVRACVCVCVCFGGWVPEFMIVC